MRRREKEKESEEEVLTNSFDEFFFDCLRFSFAPVQCNELCQEFHASIILGRLEVEVLTIICWPEVLFNELVFLLNGGCKDELRLVISHLLRKRELIIIIINVET
jgi:hypothetical protein